MEISTPHGTKEVLFTKFSALDGLEFRDRFTAFANSRDPKYRRAYVMAVLSSVFVIVGSQRFAMSTSALIDNHLCTEENIQSVFIGALAFNGIHPSDCAGRVHTMTAIGNEIATSFLSECMDSMGQFVSFLNKSE
jgi:hypothetical protein